MHDLEETLCQAKIWIKECSTNHPNCPDCLSGNTSRHPTRLIDVGPADGSRDPFLFITTSPITQVNAKKNSLHESSQVILDLENLEGPRTATEVKMRDGWYVALSYRWGQTANITTTVENIAARRAGIPWDTIPHTIQDAITITRRLGIQYLWVDALCIIQGSLDWEVESPKMAQVYGGAFLTISAALAPDSSHGILSRTGRAVLQPLASSNYPLQNDPLYSRAWALQERFLSPRLLIFGSDQLYWECAERQVGKNGKKIGKIVSWRMPSRISSAELIHWHAIVRDYTGRLLTVEADKLPAIAGIATLLCQVTGDQYLAGMWRKQIIGDLLWRQMYVGHGHQAPLGVPLEYRAPSWSWASLDGNVMFSLSGRPRYNAVTEVLGTYIDVIKRLETPTGEWLWLRGPLFEAYVNEQKVQVLDRGLGVAWMDKREDNTNKDELFTSAIPRSTINLECTSMPNVWCLLLAIDHGEGFGLILEKKEAEKKAIPAPNFKRLGSFIVRDPQWQSFIAINSAEKSELFII